MVRAEGISAANGPVADALSGALPSISAPAPFAFRIGSDGTWFYHGSPITRKPLVALFASYLSREGDGSYWLTTALERWPVIVDDAPFTAVAVRREGEGEAQRLIFRTNLDEEVVAGPAHPLRVRPDPMGLEWNSGHPRPYIVLSDRLEALILRPVYYDLVAWGASEQVNGIEVFTVWSDGQRFALGRVGSEE